MSESKEERTKIIVAFACFLLFFAGVFLMVFTVGSRQTPPPIVTPRSTPTVTSTPVQSPPEPAPDPTQGNLTPEEIKAAEALEAERNSATPR